jgi:hypothetical protein
MTAKRNEHKKVMACEVPVASLLDRRMVAGAYFCDAYRAPLRHADAAPGACFAAIFGQLPGWLKLALLARNAFAAAIGLRVPTSAAMLRPALTGPFEVGQLIGPWRIYAINERELIAGEDNWHLDFRLSVLVQDQAQGATVVVSTVCTVHRRFGKAYLFFVAPVHKVALQSLMNKAIGRRRM